MAAALTILLLALIPGSHQLPDLGWVFAVVLVAIGVGFFSLGAVVWLRRPDNRTGLLMLIEGLVILVTGLQISSNEWLFIIGSLTDALVISAFIHMLVAFPSGRLESRAARIVVGAAYAAAACRSRSSCSARGPTSAATPTHPCPPNPLLIEPHSTLTDVVEGVQAITLVGAALVTVVLLLRRYRASGPARAPRARAGAPRRRRDPAARDHPGGAPGHGGRPRRAGRLLHRVRAAAGRVPRSASRAAACCAARRSRGSSTASSATRAPPGSTPPSAGCCRTPPCSSPTGSTTARATSIATAARCSSRRPDNGEGRVATEVAHDGRVVAAVVHDAALSEESELLRAAAGTAALAIENARLEAQLRARLAALRASRARLVEAGDAERRRLGRDLHDGAQQRLVSLMLELQIARERWERDPPMARGLVDQAFDNARAAVDELRDLASGIHPAVLTQRGLDAALESLATRSTVPVELGDPLDERLPLPVETAAYYVVAEALTNVAKYADATHARVEVRRDDGELVVEVRDDGAGGADPAGGSGLRGLADRVGALDGCARSGEPGGRGDARARGHPGRRLSRRATAAGTSARRARGGGPRSPGGDPELGEDARDVLLDGGGGDDERLGDPLVRAALAISSSTSRSRGVRSSSGSSRRRRPSIRATTSGSSAEPPSATRRTASANAAKSATRSLSR